MCDIVYICTFFCLTSPLGFRNPPQTTAIAITPNQPAVPFLAPSQPTSLPYQPLSRPGKTTSTSTKITQPLLTEQYTGIQGTITNHIPEMRNPHASQESEASDVMPIRRMAMVAVVISIMTLETILVTAILVFRYKMMNYDQDMIHATYSE
ncbi:unnamed protein product [Meganyctiphanes norvegica]|uniref:Uncharacterized protein n=1 Tax=Meganyctiphanes norvegica TaxID=48144 RepID=A0AAV2QC62_MEGNR